MPGQSAGAFNTKHCARLRDAGTADCEQGDDSAIMLPTIKCPCTDHGDTVQIASRKVPAIAAAKVLPTSLASSQVRPARDHKFSPSFAQLLRVLIYYVTL
jgi:hypothetical protein